MTILAIPGMPGESIDSRLLPDIAWLIKHYKVRVTDGYAATGHASGGDHPKGAGVDLVPDTSRGGTWDDVDRLAADAKANPDVFRWIGYNGVPNHGRGHHLHLSWHGFGTDGDTQPVKLFVDSRKGGPGVLDAAADAAGVFGPAGSIVGGVLAGGEDVINGAADVVGSVAETTAKAIAGLLVDAIGEHGARVLLSIGLVAGAVAAIGYGVARTAGLRTPPLPLPPAAMAAQLALKGATK